MPSGEEGREPRDKKAAVEFGLIHTEANDDGSLFAAPDAAKLIRPPKLKPVYTDWHGRHAPCSDCIDRAHAETMLSGGTAWRGDIWRVRPAAVSRKVGDSRWMLCRMHARARIDSEEKA